MPDVTQHPIYSPNGTIVIYHDVPLDSAYVHSFNSYKGNFESAISSYAKYTLYSQSYSRLTNGSVRVEKFKGDLIHCNYLKITNGINGENIPFYCFIESVEYVNNTTSDINFTIDYLQTYWNYFTIPYNFIEREHCAVSDDVVGKNLYPESFELGDYIINNFVDKPYSSGTKYNVVMYVPNLTVGNDGTVSDAKYVNYSNGDISVSNIPNADLFVAGTRCGFGDTPCCLAIPASDVTSLNKAINALLNNSCSIVNIVQIYGDMYNDNFISGSVGVHTVSITEGTSFKRVDNSLYTPRNHKLLNYPFRMLSVSNNNGQIADFKWELFSTRSESVVSAEFVNHNMFLPTPKGVLFPRNYRGKTNDFENSIEIDDFPQGNWNEDSYAKWWAQNKTNYGLSLATGVISTGIMIATAGASAGTQASMIANEGSVALAKMANANLAGLPRTALNYNLRASSLFEKEEMARKSGIGRQGFSLGMGALGIAKTLGQKQVAKATPDNAQIQRNNALTNVFQGRFGFTLYDMAISGEMAEIIDSYFDMYGYACNKVKLPNFMGANARPIFNYIKMQNCFVKAQTGDRGLPDEAQNVIQSIFNNGITLWSDISDIGNYNLANNNR